MNDDDFDEDEKEDVENLTLCDEEFDLVDKLSAGSLGLQVRAVRFPTALLIWWRGLVLLGPWLTLAPSWCAFFCQNLAGKRIVPILMDLTPYQHPQLSTAAFEVLCRSYSQRKVGRDPSPPGMVVGTPWGLFLPHAPHLCVVSLTPRSFSFLPAPLCSASSTPLVACSCLWTRRLWRRTRSCRTRWRSCVSLLRTGRSGCSWPSLRTPRT